MAASMLLPQPCPNVLLHHPWDCDRLSRRVVPLGNARKFSHEFRRPQFSKHSPITGRCSANKESEESASSVGSNQRDSQSRVTHGPGSRLGLIFSSGQPGAWDSGGVGGAVVRRYQGDNLERWMMWYQGWQQEATDSGEVPCASAAKVGIAASSNGLHWSRGAEKVVTDARGQGGEGLVLEPSANWWAFDTRHVSVSDVLIMSSHKVRASSGVYWMFYEGGNAEEIEVTSAQLGQALLPRKKSLFQAEGPGVRMEGIRTRPGLAMSQDGRNWATIEGEHHSGALFDCGEEEGQWDSLCVAAPQAVFHEAGDIRLYYHSVDPSTGQSHVGFARSPDGLKWVKFGKLFGPSSQPGSFDEAGVAARHVVPHPVEDKGYLMFYEGINAEGRRSIGLAQSEDGLFKWERVSNKPVLEPSDVKGAWDAWSVGRPCFVDMGDETFRLYFEGISEDGVTGIGVAESEGSLTRFFRVPVPILD